MEFQDWKAPKWIKLDHSAIIYPATMSKKLSAMYRLSVTLNEVVDPELLQEALCEVMPRFPTFAYHLRGGIFWDYLEHVNGLPTIREDAANPMISILSEKDHRFLFRIRYFHKRISLEVFHALADGTGALSFIMTMVSVYLRKKHGVHIPSAQYILSTDDKPSAEEVEDSFPRYRGEKGTIIRERKAYHYRGTTISPHLLGIITGIIPVVRLKQVVDKYHCSVTVFLAAVMALALQQQQTAEGRKKKPINISIPINLRPRFASKTLRNFSYWMIVGIPAQYGEYSLEEIITLFQAQTQIQLNSKELRARFTGTMSIADSPFFRIMPLFLKHWMLNLGDRILGDASCSHSLSNLGQITVPGEMEPYLRDIRSFMGRPRGKPGSGTCISFGENLYLTFSRKIHETCFERLFFTSLVKMGVPVMVESNAVR